jgi:hypothetical protein
MSAGVMTRGGVAYDTSPNLEVSGALEVGGGATVGTTLDVTGDVTAAGGFRRSIGGFGVTLAASQTDAALTYGGKAGAGWVAPRPGSIMALSAQLLAAITGSTKTCIVKVYKNGVAVATALVTFTTGGAEVALYVTLAKDAQTFAAGDVITVGYTTTAITNTPDLTASVEVEC